MDASDSLHVLVVGSCMTDLVATVPRLPRVGETLVGNSFTVGFGGKGANQAVQIARLGGRVAFVARVGDDDFGRSTLANLQRERVDARFVAAVAGASTGVAPIHVAADGSNTVVIVPGANDALDAASVERACAALPPAPVVLAQLEVPDDAVRAAFACARARGARSVLNPAPARALAEDLLTLADVLIPNETELASLTGITDPDLLGIARAARALRRRPGQVVLVTLGARGVWVDEDGEAGLVAAPAARAVDTTGAGDAFVGAFALLLARGASVHTAVERAARIASASVERFGTQTSFIDAAEAEERGIDLHG